jgi:hypothetical protein
MARFRSRSFRASAVSIVAAFAPAGCESESVDAAKSCPAQPPSEGDSCQGALDCVYERCSYDQHPTSQFICEMGSFRNRRTSCNPPWFLDSGSRDAGADAGDASITSCPAQPPAQGQLCVGDLACVYERCLNGGGHPTREALCIDGAISNRFASCNPPPPDASFAGDASRSDASTDASQGIDGG